jgi:lactoylglutathione lyase
MGQPSLQVTGINHVVLHVADIERSARFYTDVLGFEDRNRIEVAERKMSFLRCGDQGLDLFEVDSDVHAGEEMNHMALSVAASSVDEIEDQLSGLGISSERTPRSSVFILDPDGHRLEVLPRSARVREGERLDAGLSG